MQTTMTSTKILVVDDDPCGRKLLASYLRPKGYDVTEASSGEEALATASKIRPAVMLLDVMMPGMTGLEVCNRIKNSRDTRSTQIMMVTALGTENDLVEGLDNGADDYIVKPVRRAEFLAKVRSLVRAGKLLEELNEARRDLADRNRELELKKTLAQAVVHDLRGPLTIVKGNLDLLAQRAECRDFPALGRATTGVQRMAGMVMDLLDVECIGEGGFEPSTEECDLLTIARESGEAFGISGSSKGVEFAFDGSGDPCMVEADPGLLRRVVDNLLVNALSYSSEGMEIKMTVAHRPEGILLEVTDQGVGVPEAQREKIFEKYSRADVETTKVRNNRGLGLTFCQLAIEAHGGTIWVDDGPAGGARFQFVLPELVSRDQQGPEKDNIIWFSEEVELARTTVQTQG